MRNIRRTWTMGLALLALSAGTDAEAQAAACTDDTPARPSLGIQTFHCQGGSCLVSGSAATTGSRIPDEAREAREENPWAWDFSTEPRLWEIEAGGPASGKIRGGDVLMAVDGAPITTRRAGRILTEMQPGQDVTLTIRRGGSVRNVEITVGSQCDPIRASAGPDDRPWNLEERQRRDPPPPLAPEVSEDVGLTRLPSLGLTLLAPKDIEVGATGEVTWVFKELPVAARLEDGGPAAEAGILPGETLVTVGGAFLNTAEGTANLARVAAGEALPIFVRRGNAARQVEIRAR